MNNVFSFMFVPCVAGDEIGFCNPGESGERNDVLKLLVIPVQFPSAVSQDLYGS